MRWTRIALRVSWMPRAPPGGRRPRDKATSGEHGYVGYGEDGPELAALQKLIADHGYYPYRAEPGELEAMQADGTLDGLFLRLMRERLTEWLAIADERLRPRGVPLYFRS